MPSKNIIKEFVADSYYHIYNRGVEKRIIFTDPQDYNVFLSYVKEYVEPINKEMYYKTILDPHSTSRAKDNALKLLRMNNFHGSLAVHAYCLMNNHFHLLVHQKEDRTIDKFMNSLATRYSMYFNRKYKRVGRLFQGVYKAVRVTTEEQLLQLSRYIHRNPFEFQGDALEPRSLDIYLYSSYKRYLGNNKDSWVEKATILSYFSTNYPQLTYKAFVTKNDIEDNVKIISKVSLD